MFTKEQVLQKLSDPVHNKPLFIANHQDQTQFPEDLSTLSFDKHLPGGDGGVYLLKDAQGNRYTFKASVDLNHLKEQLIADVWYQTMGCPVPDLAIINEIPPCLASYNLPQNGIYRLAKFISSDEEKQSASFTQDEFAKHFLLDALFANWDVGTSRNILLGQNGTLYRLDNGGALRYRATGGLKAQNMNWSAHHVDELNSLRDPKMNESAAQMYKNLKPEDLEIQFQRIIKLAGALLPTLNQLDQVLQIPEVEKLRAFITNRLYDLEIRLNPTSHPYSRAFENLGAHPQHNSASILSICTIDNTPCLLLGKRVRHEWYCDFGGKSEFGDETLFVTASREAHEETGAKLNVPAAFLEHCAFHDLITSEAGKTHTHRMFITEQRYIPTSELDLAVKTKLYDQEYTQFEWVPIDALLSALKNNTRVVEEGVETLQIGYTSPETGQSKTITLFPDIAKMFQQAPVEAILQARAQNKPLIVQKTRSHFGQDYHAFQTAPKSSTFENKDDRQIPIRTLNYGSSSLVEERIYPDPKAQLRSLLRKTVMGAQVQQELKRKSGSEPQEHKKDSLKTQSIAHLQGLLESKETDAATLVHEFFKKENDLDMAKDMDFQAKLIEVVQAESEYPNHAVLYHGTNSKIGFFYDFISMLRSLLVIDDIRSLRAFDKVFEGIEDVEAFVAEQCKKQGVKSPQELSNYASDYQEKGLSCNYSLFGNYDQTSSSSIDFFYLNSSSTNNDKSILIKAITMVLAHLGIQKVIPEQLLALYDQYENVLSGHLYQLFIEADEVDKLCYFSASGGHFHDFTTPWLKDATPKEQHQLSKVINALCESPKEFVNNPVLKKKSSLQARLYAHPARMRDFVTIKTYKTKETPQLMLEKLSVFVQQIGEELLQKKQFLLQDYQASTEGEEKLLPLQRVHKYVMRGEANEEIRYEKNYDLEIESLYEHIESGNTALFQEVLQAIPLEVNINQLLSKSTLKGDEKESLLHFALRYRRSDIAKILLKGKHLKAMCLLQTNKDGKTPLVFALDQYLPDVVEAIVNHPLCSPKCFFDPKTNALLRASEYKDLALVRTVLESQHCTPYCLEYANAQGYNALTFALSLRLLNIADILVNNKNFRADCLFYPNKEGENALTLALKRGDQRTIDYLRRISKPEFLLEQAIKHYHSAIIWADILGYAEVVQIILENEHSAEKLLIPVYNDQDTLLIWAVKRQRIGLCQAILNSTHCSLDCFLQSDAEGNTALAIAILRRDVHLTKILLESTAFTLNSLFQPNQAGETALFLAVKVNNNAIIQLLENIFPDKLGQKRVIEEIIEQYIKGDFLLRWHKKSFFTWAIESRPDIAIALLENKHWSFKVLMHQENDALCQAARFGRLDLVKAMLENPNCTPEVLNHSDGYKNALTWAIHMENISMVQLLLENKYCTSEFYTFKYMNDTCLMWAAAYNKVDMVNVLLQSQYCTPEFMRSTDEKGNNALMLAIKKAKPENVKAFLNCSAFREACLSQVNKAGETALTLAVKKGHPEIIALLKESEARVQRSIHDTTQSLRFLGSVEHSQLPPASPDCQGLSEEPMDEAETPGLCGIL